MNEYYVDYLKGAGKSKQTIKNYVCHINLALNDIGKPDTEITFLDMVKWESGLSSYSTSTINIKVKAIKSYFAFLTQCKIIKDNPTIGLSVPKIVNKKKPDPSAEMIRALINIANSARDKAMLLLFASTGLRFEEAISITKSQYTQRKFDIIGKGNKVREIYINDEVKKLCDEYLKTRKDSSNLLFVSKNGKPVDNSNWCKKIKIYAKAANFSCWKEISPHWLRHAFATQASQMGVPVADIGFALGHSDYAKVTTRYIHTPQNKVRDIMNNITF